MKNLTNLALSALMCVVTCQSTVAQTTWRRGDAIALYVGPAEAEVVRTAASIVERDYAAVMGGRVDRTSARRADVIAATLGDKELYRMARRDGLDLGRLVGRHEAFVVQVVGRRIVVAGSDKRGTAYGLMELSRRLGVSPWEWWADVTPLPLDSMVWPADLRIEDSPAVAYRGIFLNDEDWGMTPWASLNYEPRHKANVRKGEIGPATHARIFELLLRLRANTFWPAMHECSVPFYAVAGNRDVADRYGIVVSTSHCEPMMRNANGEWREWASDPKGVKYNYVANRDSVLLFWDQRLAELEQSDCIYTLGMRGIHDGKMQGARTIGEQVAALTDIIGEQRRLIARHKGDPTRVPQQFVPYKEVLDCYNAGLDVPDDVTFIWCDDNYGYLTHMPTEAERRRSGGNGVYYHISYWGRPHDYTWLPTQHPELIREEMLRGYDHGIDRIWIVNVGDLKPMEFQTQLFLDMAWNPDAFRADTAIAAYTRRWYSQQLGIDARGIEQMWRKFYDLSWHWKPEFMAGTRTEEADRAYWSAPHDLPLSEGQVHGRVASARELAWLASCYADVPVERRAAYFELVEYPVATVAAHNEKWLAAQLARHGVGEWWRSREAHDRVARLNDEYNAMLDGKWRGMISATQRGLTVYRPAPQDTTTLPMAEGQRGQLVYLSGSVVGDALPVGDTLVLTVPSATDTLRLELHTLPVHPVRGQQTRYTVSVDGSEPVVVEFHTVGRSEEWKQNVTRNRAVRRVALDVDPSLAEHCVVLTALDDGVRLEAVYVGE